MAGPPSSPRPTRTAAAATLTAPTASQVLLWEGGSAAAEET